MAKLYLGISGAKRVLFWCGQIPTEASHGAYYNMVIGPFKTVRGARFARDYGHNNPHVMSVSDAENLARTLEASSSQPVE